MIQNRMIMILNKSDLLKGSFDPINPKYLNNVSSANRFSRKVGYKQSLGKDFLQVFQGSGNRKDGGYNF